MITNILEYLYHTAARVPDKLAFSDGQCSLTFRALTEKTEAVAAFLLAAGHSSGPVGVFMERSPLEIAVFLGVVRAGCFYVPMDAEMGEERLKGIAARMRLSCILADAAGLGTARSLVPDGAFAAEEALSCPVSALPPLSGSDTDPFYTVFTSGSTGLPKGVCGCHRAVIDYAEHMLPAVGIGEDAIMGCQAPLYFDACFKELLACLVRGASVYLVPRPLFSQPLELVRFLNRYQINTVCWVSSAFSLVAALKTFRYEKPEYLRTVCFGSEVFPPKHLRAWQEACPGARFINLYGPTECTGMSCFYPVPGSVADGEKIPIGRPFVNTRVYLIDENGHEAREGEICIGGTCVTLGYFNDPQRTSEAFVQNPLHNDYPDRVYRTGDLAAYNEHGDLVFLGRADQQIKRMGHRIELGEIESTAASLPGVEQCVCLFAAKSGVLLLLYTGRAESAEVLAALDTKLPVFARPQRVERLESMPTTPNGKADRRKLKERYGC